MSVMIQVRNVPERVHRTLKARAAFAGKSVSALIRDELVAMAALPSKAALRDRLARNGTFCHEEIIHRSCTTGARCFVSRFCTRAGESLPVSHRGY
ncbi:MAG TPA: hypothetical protein VKV22_10000 [Rhodanobacteraceae bacterium]|nr:hypothetical protein [Rhodanobacteraceae bacterium]